jgi:hypothetical protein
MSLKKSNLPGAELSKPMQELTGKCPVYDHLGFYGLK